MKENEGKIGTSALILTVSKFVVLALSMVTTMLLSRFRTLEEYGTYSQMLLTSGLVVSLFSLGLPNSVNYFLARAENAEEKNRFLSVYYTLNTIIGVLIGVVMSLAAPAIEKYFNNPMIKQFVFFIVIYPWTNITISGLDNVLVVCDKNKKLLVFRFLHSLSVVLAVLLAVICELSFRQYIFIYISVEVLFAVIVYAIVSNVVGRISFFLDREFIKKIFVFSIPIGLAMSLGTINIELDKLMVGRVFGTENLAVYTNSAKVLPVNIITASLNAVVLPKIVRCIKNDKYKEAIELWGNASLFSFIILSVFSSIFIVLAEEIISILYSEKYLAGTGVFMVINGTLFTSFTYFGMVLNATGKTKFILYSSIISLLVNIILNTLFMFLFGMIGAAIATVVSVSVIAMVQLIYSAKCLNVKVKDLMPWKKFMLCIIFCGIITYVCWLLKNIIAVYFNIYILCIVLGFVFVMLYFIVYLKTIKCLWGKLQRNGENL